MKCKCCGKETPSGDKCFTCEFWEDMLKRDQAEDSHLHFVAEGAHYCIGDEDSTSYFRGFDGAKVTITFNDGTVVKSSNLWYQGEIPENFRDKFPDTAKIEWKW